MTTIRFLVLTLILGFLGCKEAGSNGNSHAGTPTGTIREEPASNNSEIIYIANVDKLTIREVPDKKGAPIGKLMYGQEATYLDEESDFKEKIELRGMVRYDSWKKVRLGPANGQQTIEGWVYGGGLSLKSELFEEVEPNRYSRTIIRASKEELSNVLGIPIGDKYFYDGEVSYRKSEGEYVKHGKFKVKGLELYDMGGGFEYEVSSEITGSYKDGIPDGVFERKHVGYEDANVSTVFYEDGKCLWSSIMGSAEGEDYNHREENPKDCSFEYILNRLFAPH